MKTKDFLFAKGDIPIALVAHMDTVFSFPPREIFYDSEKTTFWSPEGLGADDRAGVFAIIKIINSGLRPYVIFTTDEEIGGFGADAISEYVKPEGLKYLIELDRQGENDCVFYQCDNRDFVDYVETFGFEEAIGTFSDISIICPQWKICGVNLSIGYKNEHSICEILNVQNMLKTINRVIRMLKEDNIPDFEYVMKTFPEKKSIFEDEFWETEPTLIDSNLVECFGCNRIGQKEEMLEMVDRKGNSVYYCIDCIPNQEFNWCKRCNVPFETEDISEEICPLCKEEEENNA